MAISRCLTRRRRLSVFLNPSFRIAPMAVHRAGSHAAAVRGVPSDRRASMIRILLADDHDLFRGHLRELLDQRPGMQVIADAADGQAALDTMRNLDVKARPDVAVVDVRMGVMDGIEATRRLLRLHPALRVLALSSHDDPVLVAAMVEAGCRGYVLKTDPLPQLVLAIEAVAAGRRFFSTALGIPEPESPHPSDVPRQEPPLS